MNIFTHTPEKQVQLLKKNELETTLLSNEVITLNEAIEKCCKEEEKFCATTNNDIWDYIKVTVLPVPSLDQRSEFQVFSNVMLNSTDKSDVKYFGESF